MAETVFEELKRYVGFTSLDEEALRVLHPRARAHFPHIADVFYARIQGNPEARRVLEGGESTVGRLHGTLQEWLEELLRGPWDVAYFEKRCRIGRVHVRIGMPQHYMFGAMNVVRQELEALVAEEGAQAEAIRLAVGKILDLELAIMLHTYREDLLVQQARTERLATFGQLVGSIGHELRNPLGVIETSLFILKGRPLAEDARVAKHLQRIGEQVALANGIVTNLLDMIRDRPLNRQRVDLAQAWEAAAGSVERPEEVSLSVTGLEGLPEVEGDALQLRQVFHNLLDNAVQAVGEKGEVRLEAQRDGDAVCLAIEDSGPGLPTEVRARLFEPLITTRARGIGLGLPLVRRIVERHGGSVSYAPRPGAGARFLLRLPAAPAVTPPSP